MFKIFTVIALALCLGLSSCNDAPTITDATDSTLVSKDSIRTDSL